MTAVPDAMRVAVYRQRNEIEVEDRPVPEVGPHDVLLEVSHCGICGSDIHFVLEGWGQPGSVEGHEWAGRVVAVGDAVTEWSVGDEVVGGPSPRCGECEYCQAGRPSLCTGRNTPGMSAHADGAFAEYTLSDERGLRRVPNGMSLRAAALAEPLAVALHGLTRGGVHAGQRLLVTGAGPIGSLSVAAARARGVTDIVVSEPHPFRRALAERLGAVAVEPDTLVAPRSPGDTVDEPFDVALECSGHAVA
ncbi:MAG TPA: alcohol dehydrogenase catalytic domain-containing protein, partial [Acidimicrobiia bacterium]|nr:alcohol dehydrogenase catalytic domain-containing protein [Acidimicrobiia bacterium]